MSNCDRMPLLELVQDRLNPKSAEEIVLHLSDCTRCSQRFEVMLHLDALLNPEQRDTRLPVPAVAGLDRPEKSVPFRPPEAPPKSSGSPSSLWLAAAALLAALLIPVIFRPTTAPPQLAARWATSQKPAEFPLVTRSTSPSGLREEAFAAYHRNAYGEAERRFGRLPITRETQFYRGVCLYFLGRNQEALSLLEKAGVGESRWRLPALWYQANTLLRLHRLGEARDLLRIVAATEGAYQEQSQHLLEKVAQ